MLLLLTDFENIDYSGFEKNNRKGRNDSGSIESFGTSLRPYV
jgi:hypothetical protein